MRVAEFLILLLEAHGQTLQRLAALFGEDTLYELLESAGDDDDFEKPEQKKAKIIPFPQDWVESAPAGFSGGSAYAEIAGAVQEMNLPEVLEFHLWAYPHYRAFIESSVDLNSKIRGSGSDAGMILVQEAINQAEAWVRKLPLPPELSHQAERAAQIPWLRFRTHALKRIGKRPLGPVY